VAARRLLSTAVVVVGARIRQEVYQAARQVQSIEANQATVVQIDNRVVEIRLILPELARLEIDIRQQDALRFAAQTKQQEQTSAVQLKVAKTKRQEVRVQIQQTIVLTTVEASQEEVT